MRLHERVTLPGAGAETVGPLVVRPHWREDESWPGYLLRLANANGYHGVYPLARRSGISVGSLLSEKHDETLRRFGVQGLVVSAPRPLSTVLPRVGRPHGAGPQTRSRLCPTCVGASSSSHVLATWESPMAFVCSVHETMLHDRCAACSTRIDYSRDDLLFCNCGSSYALMATASPPSWYSNLLTALTANSTQRDWKSDVAAAHVLLSLAHWPADKSSPRKLRPATWDFVGSNDLPSLAPWFTDWPRGFVAQLRQRQDDGTRMPSKPFPHDVRQFPVLNAAVKMIRTRA